MLCLLCLFSMSPIRTKTAVIVMTPFSFPEWMKEQYLVVCRRRLRVSLSPWGQSRECCRRRGCCCVRKAASAAVFCPRARWGLSVATTASVVEPARFSPSVTTSLRCAMVFVVPCLAPHSFPHARSSGLCTPVIHRNQYERTRQSNAKVLAGMHTTNRQSLPSLIANTPKMTGRSVESSQSLAAVRGMTCRPAAGFFLVAVG